MAPVVSLEHISAVLVGLVPQLGIKIRGEWTARKRRTYVSDGQIFSGAGPFVEVADMRWRGDLECSAPLTGIAFLSTGREIYWAKSGRPTDGPFVEVSLRARADYVDGRAILSTDLMGSMLPGVPVAFDGNVDASCSLGPAQFATGRAHLVATVGEVALSVLLLQRNVIKMGRKNLWHLRDEFASSLPEDVRTVFTRGRTGKLQTGGRSTG